MKKKWFHKSSYDELTEEDVKAFQADMIRIFKAFNMNLEFNPDYEKGPRDAVVSVPVRSRLWLMRVDSEQLNENLEELNKDINKEAAKVGVKFNENGDQE